MERIDGDYISTVEVFFFPEALQQSKNKQYSSLHTAMQVEFSCTRKLSRFPQNELCRVIIITSCSLNHDLI